MNWFDIIKNQMSISGLNMRQMDLDNIIDEDDDDCETKVKNFVDRVNALKKGYSVSAEEGQILGAVQYNVDAPFLEEEYCWILDKIQKSVNGGLDFKKLGYSTFVHNDSLGEDVIFSCKKYINVDIAKRDNPRTIFYYNFRHGNDGVQLYIDGHDIDMVEEFVRRNT